MPRTSHAHSHACERGACRVGTRWRALHGNTHAALTPALAAPRRTAAGRSARTAYAREAARVHTDHVRASVPHQRGALGGVVRGGRVQADRARALQQRAERVGLLQCAGGRGQPPQLRVQARRLGVRARAARGAQRVEHCRARRACPSGRCLREQRQQADTPYPRCAVFETGDTAACVTRCIQATCREAAILGALLFQPTPLSESRATGDP